MASRVALLVIACAASSVAGLRRKSNSASSGFVRVRTPPRFVNKTSMLERREVNCDQYDGLTVRDVAIGDALAPVCRFWPSFWGTFPIESVDRAVELLDMAFEPGGLWDKFKELQEERGKNSEFCWRATDVRLTRDDVPLCFEQRHKYTPNSMPGTERTKEPSEYWCQKRCQLTSGCKHFSYWWDSGCHLQDGNAKRKWDILSQTGPPRCQPSLLQLNASSTKAEESSDCEEIYNGKCYGACPSGFRPSTFQKYFAPVCMSDCKHTPGFSVGCGGGCATSVRNCVDTIMDQVSGVVTSVGKAVAYATGNVAVYKVVEQLLGLAEFIVTILWELIQVSKEIWALWGEADSVASFVTMFLAFAQKKAAEKGQSKDTLVALFQNVLGFWADLANEGLTFKKAPLDFLTRTLEEFGEETGDAGEEVDSAWGLIEPFVYPSCEVDK